MRTKSIYYQVFFVILLTSVCFAQTSFSQGIWATASTQGFTERYALSASVVNEKIYAIGGLTGKGTKAIRNPFEVYDPVANTWTTPVTTDSLIPRDHFSSNNINDKIYVMGGGNQPLQIFDPVTNTWSTPSVTGSSHVFFAFSTSVINGKIYVVGGIGETKVRDTMDVFDPQTNTWTAFKTTGSHLYRSNVCTEVVNGKIYVMGGDSISNIPLNVVEVFDPSNNTWTTLTTVGSMTPRWGATANVVGGKIYVFGGVNGYADPLNITEVLDPITNTWTQPTTTGNMTPRYMLTSAEVNGKVYLLGGDTVGGVSNLNEVFTPQPSSVKNNPEVNMIALFPNPTTGNITLHNLPQNISAISVVNTLGQNVLQFKNISSNDFMIDLSTLPSGLYYAKITTVNLVQMKKIIKE